MSTVVAAPLTRHRRLVGPHARAGRAVLWAVLLGALALSLAPGLYMVSLSFMDNPQLFAGRVVPVPPHPENYPRAWVASNIGRLYWNSIYVSTVSMVVTVAISALAGYGLGRIRFAGRGVVYGIVLVGLTIPLQIALIPLFINLRTLGLINTPLALIGPYTAFGLAFGIYIMKGFFQGLPRELEEAARLDGAGEFRIFAWVMLPLTRPPHRDLRAALERVLRQLPHPGGVARALLRPRPRALLPVPAAVHRGPDGRRREAVRTRPPGGVPQNSRRGAPSELRRGARASPVWQNDDEEIDTNAYRQRSLHRR